MNIPQELKSLARWIVWNVNSIIPKAPHAVRGGVASSTDPSTWSNYEDAVAASPYIGFVFNGDGIIGIDLDKCFDQPWALDIIRSLDSYTEISPSGTGYHIFVRGILPPGGNKKGRVEMYDRGRYFTVTGNHVAGTPLIIKTRDLVDLHARMIAGTLEGGIIIPKTPENPDNSAREWGWMMNLIQELGRDVETLEEQFRIRYASRFRDKWNDKRRNKATGEPITWLTYMIHNALALKPDVDSGKAIAAILNTWESDDEIIQTVLVSRTTKDFLADESIKPRKPLLQIVKDGYASDFPLITESSINQLFAWRGTGKTNFMIGLGKCFAVGEDFLYFRAVEPMPILFVEGEMPEADLKYRMATQGLQESEYFNVVAVDFQEGKQITSLFEPAGKRLIEERIAATKAKVLILDSISSLFGFDSNAETKWNTVNRWFTKLRSQGLAIIYANHAGKDRQQGTRGHSKGDDPLDVSIKLENPKLHKIHQGLRAVLSYEKLRAYAPAAESIEISLQFATADGPHQVKWGWENIDARNLRVVTETLAINPEATGKEIAELLGISASEAGRLRLSVLKATRPKPNFMPRGREE